MARARTNAPEHDDVDNARVGAPGIAPGIALRAAPRARRALFRAAARLADAWLPRPCGLCGRALDEHERGACARCVALLPGRAATRCPACALRRAAGAGCACGDGAPYGHTFALADYAPPLDRAIVALKFRGEIALGRAFAALAAPLVRAGPAPGPEVVCAVPLSAPRLAARGYNQALAIAAPLARELGLPLAPALLARTRDTAAQSTLALDARARNLDGAFVAHPSARGRRVLVVDDVMTSGATLAAAASALRSAGALHVANLVVARTA